MIFSPGGAAVSLISASVGKGGANQRPDVIRIQTLLNENMRKLSEIKRLRVDGAAGKLTIAAIEAFQKKVVGMSKPDGRVDPHGETFKRLRGCGCDQPDENYPYSQTTFATIGNLASLIHQFSHKFNVPPVAVAGSIADEFNTRRSVKGTLDWFQDRILLNYMPNFAIEVDARAGFKSKLLNATMHDLGKGNIKLDTARQIYEQYKSNFARKNMDYADLVDYILTDTGTVHIASLVIRKAKDELAAFVKGTSQEKIEAIYVTYYKQGPSYVQRFKASLAKDPTRHLEPGEGCRVILQREKFLTALKLKD
jgi:hypothetical protein